MHLDSGLAVEHIQPKNLQKDKKLLWNNFLLSCVNCNSIKGKTDINDANITDFLWPDTNNTFLALKYTEGGVIDVNPNLPKVVQEKAQRLIKLVGLDRNPSNNSIASDRRWENRLAEWGKANRAKMRLAQTDTPQMREQILDTAEAYFSIWMTVFSDDSAMLKGLIQKFKGTSTDCFDEDGQPIPRTSTI
jgi:uncharacterized protein (TIGR02646 family)